MSLYTCKNGACRQVSTLYTQKAGAARTVSTAYIGKNGALTPLFSEGTMLADLPIGATVTLYEGTEQATYRIWDKNYRNTDTILLLREEALPTPLIWGTSPIDYTDSQVDAYLRDTLVPSLPPSLRQMLVETEIPILHNAGDGPATVYTAMRTCFVPSVGEMSDSSEQMPAYMPMDGERLDYYESTLMTHYDPTTPRVTTDNGGTPRTWWLRSAYPYYMTAVTNHGFAVNADGTLTHAAFDACLYVRPALTVDARYILE